MVNAGLYLVARMFPFFGAEALHGDLDDLAFIIAAIGGITAVMAAAIAFVRDGLEEGLGLLDNESTGLYFHWTWMRNVPRKYP